LGEEDDFDTIVSILEGGKARQIEELRDSAISIFRSYQLTLEIVVNELAANGSKFKGDAEVQVMILNILQVLTDWKTEMKVYLAKSPVLGDGLS
jgi:hypothetical protein